MAEEYVNKESLAKHIDSRFGEISTPFVVREIRAFPTADVAPRAEAEKWFRECEELQGRMIELEREVAREIFEKFIIISESPYRIHIIVEKEEFDELKKKYGVTDKNVGCKIEEEKE